MHLLQIIPLVTDTIKALATDSARHVAATAAPAATTVDNTLLAAFIGAIVSFAVLFFTLAIERRKTARQEKEQRRKKLIYFAALIKPVIAYSDKQGADIKAFAETIGENPLVFPLLKYSPKSALEKIVKGFDDEPFFNAFTTHYLPFATSVRTFKEILAAVEYQNLQMNQVIEMLKTSQEFDYQRRLEFQAAMNAATSTISNAIADKTMEAYPVQLKAATDTLEDFLRNRTDESDLTYAYDKFIKPLKQALLNQQFFMVPIGKTILDHLHAASAVYENIRLQMQSMQEDYEEIAKNYIDSNEKLKEKSQALLNDFFDTNIV